MNRFNAAVASLALSGILWVLVFVVRPFNFWLMMSLSTLLLMVIALRIDRDKIGIHPSFRMLLLGAAGGVLLYTFFFVGFQLTKSNLVFNQGIAQVYEFRSATPNILIAMLLVFPIAPGEEVYWRGLIQRRFMEKVGKNPGLLLASCAYALVHVPTLNIPLVLTALIGGLAWGFLYMKTSSLIPAVLSHVVFDLLVFVIAPFG